MYHATGRGGTTVELAVILVYFSVLAVLGLYGLHRLYLVWLVNRLPSSGPGSAVAPGTDLPHVTVQLPVFNEVNVIERLIDAACALDYPRDKILIQVLDDSTDETRELAAELVAARQRRGLPIVRLHRRERHGFKAGALTAGLEQSHSELVAVLDADFVPPASFLRDVVGHFKDPGVGMVQARWGHINRNSSVLTKLEAHLLDGHFLIEHDARFRSGRFFNFNGTAGVWRRSCIDDAGGWEGDTLTEDLDLSYRAQLAGWRFVFLPGVEVPAELPARMPAFKSQQRRWAKGSVQTARKLLGRILRAPLPLPVKVESVCHLTANIAYPLLVLLAVLLVPGILARYSASGESSWLLLADACVILAATGSLAVFYSSAHRRASGRGWVAFVRLPALMALGIGISLSNSLAVFEGLWGPVGVFERTPKSGAVGSGGADKVRSYASASGWLPLLEILLALYTGSAVVTAVSLGLWVSVPFLVLFPAGYLSVALASLAASRPSSRRAHQLRTAVARSSR